MEIEADHQVSIENEARMEVIAMKLCLLYGVYPFSRLSKKGKLKWLKDARELLPLLSKAGSA